MSVYPGAARDRIESGQRIYDVPKAVAEYVNVRFRKYEVGDVILHEGMLWRMVP